MYREKLVKDMETTAWENVAKKYSQLIVPNRPSPDECKNYGLSIAKALKNKNDMRIMVMGATPELRRILYTYETLQNAEVFCVDINPGMYKAMTEFLAKGRNFREKFFTCSWLSTEFPEKYFDLIVGDEVIINIKPELHPVLFREISRILKENGIWITRHNNYLSEDLKNNPGNILINLAQKIKIGEYSFQLAANILWNNFLYYTNAATKLNNIMSNHLNLMKTEYQNNLKNNNEHKIIKELIDFYEDNFVSFGGSYPWYVLSETESEKELKEFFEVKEKIYSSDHPFIKNTPIYVLKNTRLHNLL